MWEIPLAVSGTGIVLLMVLFARALWYQAKKINDLRERVAWLEARVNGKKDSR